MNLRDYPLDTQTCNLTILSCKLTEDFYSGCANHYLFCLQELADIIYFLHAFLLSDSYPIEDLDYEWAGNNDETIEIMSKAMNEFILESIELHKEKYEYNIGMKRFFFAYSLPHI